MLLRILALTACLALSSGWAQQYPVRPVHLVVGFPAGGGLDLVARVVAAQLADTWKMPVPVENRTGAGGAIGAAVVAKSAPDGYTLLMSGPSLAARPAQDANQAFDPLKDLVGVALLEGQPYVMVTGGNSRFHDVGELVAAAKAAPGKLNYGSVGIGSGPHFTAESFQLAAGIDAVHVPYRGGGPEVTKDVMAGEIAYWFAPLSFVRPFLKDGRVRALAVASNRRSPMLPEIPTLAEAGVDNFQPLGYWYGIWAPARTSAQVLEKLVRDVGAAIDSPESRERLGRLGAEPAAASPAEMGSLLRREMELTARLMNAPRTRAP